MWLDIIVRLLAGSVPFIALGFAIGYLCGPNVAPAVANLVYLPLTFASGLFMPLSQLPGFVRTIAPYLPAYHYGQLGWSALGANTERLPVSLAWLAGYTVLFLAIASAPTAAKNPASSPSPPAPSPPATSRCAIAGHLRGAGPRAARPAAGRSRPA